MEILEELQKWYFSQIAINRTSKFVSVDNVDNPGWIVDVDLVGTELADKTFTFLQLERSEDNWIVCRAEDNEFKARGGPFNLIEILEIFIQWAESGEILEMNQKNCTLLKLQDWYFSQCNGDWEHEYGISIKNLDNPGWFVKIDLEETYLEDRVFNNVLQERSKNDWIQCEIKENKFEGMGGPFNLKEILQTFLNWAQSD